MRLIIPLVRISHILRSINNIWVCGYNLRETDGEEI